MEFLTQLSFLNPVILAGLAALPLLWFLLRAVPPSPKKVKLPSAFFLKDLIPDQKTVQKTPWWLLLLRSLIIACLIFGLSGPLLNQSKDLNIRDDIHLVIDNGWTSAQIWDQQIEKAQDLINRAGRAGQRIYVSTTAPEPGLEIPKHDGPFSTAQALAYLKGLKPQPWPDDYESLSNMLEEKDKESVYSFWLSDGLDQKGRGDLVRTLQSKGGLSIFIPEEKQMPLLLKKEDTLSNALEFSVQTANQKTRPVRLQAIHRQGYVMEEQSLILNTAENKENRVVFDLETEERNNIAHILIAGEKVRQKSAGTKILFDENNRRRSVGIIGTESEIQEKPFLSAEFYIQRALAPYADITIGTVDAVLEKDISVILMPDQSGLPLQTLENLEDWVEQGGMLIRFAGPDMLQGTPFLLPIPLRPGKRALSGDITFENPPLIAPIPQDSPLSGITFYDAIEVRQQALAEPVPGLSEKSWAVLDDGTPFITADKFGRGKRVLIHTTATPEWSDFVLSGAFVSILRRMVSLSAHANINTENISRRLNPVKIMDGFGDLKDPKFAKPILSQDLDKLTPGPDHPPGIYGNGNVEIAFNLSDRIQEIKPMTSFSASVDVQTYQKIEEKNLTPLFLGLAFFLFLLDWIIRMMMQINFSRFSVFPTLMFLALSAPAYADDTKSDLKYANGLHLAFFKSGDFKVDQTAQKGLLALAGTLSSRTSVEPEGIVALSYEDPSLPFFPLIYWPVSEQQQALSVKALQNIQHYLNHGGTILIDTRDYSQAFSNQSAFIGSGNTQNLREALSGLDIPALIPIPEDHVLGKSFYLLETYPGYHRGGTLWVEEDSRQGRDNVSSIIIGNHDWARAWAAETRVERLSLQGGQRQYDLAMRFGVNLVMYALTGNYKADQVHLPHILERLGN